MSMVKDNDFIQISAAMVTKLKLSGNNLLVFALIHGFSKDGEHTFNGSLSYISQWLNISKSTVIGILKLLVDANYLVKKDYYNNGVKFCTYVSNMDDFINQGGGTKTLPPYRKHDGGGTKTLPNNYNDIDSINDNTNVLSIMQDENGKPILSSDVKSSSPSNICADLTVKHKRTHKLKNETDLTWRTDYETYKALVEDARIKLKSDTEFRDKQEKYFANINYELSIDKGCDYWLSDIGYKKVKSSRGEINMLSRLKNNFDKNKIYNSIRKPIYNKESYIEQRVSDLQKDIDKVMINGQTYK